MNLLQDYCTLIRRYAMGLRNNHAGLRPTFVYPEGPIRNRKALLTTGMPLYLKNERTWQTEILMVNDNRTLWKFLSVLLLCMPFCVRAQDPNYVRIDKSKGLPSNTVYDLLQDSTGFIWMVTEEGLCRYDGYQFVSYHNSRQTSMAGSHLAQDVYGRIWYENFDGYLYYVENDSLKALEGMKPIGYSNYAITKQSLMVLNVNGLDIYDLKTLRITVSYPLLISEFFNAVQAGEFFYVGCDSVFRFSDAGVDNVISRASSSPSLNTGFFAESPDHAVWQYGKYKGEQTCYRTTGQGWSDFFTFTCKDFIQAASATEDYLWLCSTSGAFAYDAAGRPLEGGRTFFPGKSISCVLHDREDNYWFSTTNEGLLLVNDFNSRNYFSSVGVSRFFIQQDSMYCGTMNNEIYGASLPNMESHLLQHNAASHSVDYIDYCDAGFPVVCSSDSFRVLNGNRITKFAHSVKDMVAIAPGTYALATSVNCGLYFTPSASHDKWNGAWMHTDSSDGMQIHQMVRVVRGRAVTWDSVAATIYFATNKGLFSATYDGNKEIKNGEESLYLSALEFCGDVLYGLSTQGEVIRIVRNGECSSLNSTLGIPMNLLRGMQYREGQLYFYSSSEVMIMNPSASGDGVKRIPAFVTDIYDLDVWHNRIYLATPSGILVLADHDENLHAGAPLFVINSVTVGNAIYRTNALPLLTYRENNIEIAYSILSFKAAASCSLYYRINDREWELCPPDARSLKLASLAPGSYTILFRLGESDTATLSTLQFTIDHPWWSRWWAWTIYVGVFLLLTWLLYKRQLRAQERKSQLITEKIELEKNLDRSVLTSIRSQMNPHFFYNALNTIQSYIYSNDRKNAGSYLSKFSRLTRMILEMSEQELITLEEEITACRLYLELEQVRFNEDFTFTIETKNIVDATQVRLPPMLLQPYIENAIKHGLLHKKGDKRLELYFELTNSKLLVAIIDNGIGRERSTQLNALRKDRPKSFSSDANQKRLELLNRGAQNPFGVHFVDRYDANGQADGTTVMIDIPI